MKMTSISGIYKIIYNKWQIFTVFWKKNNDKVLKFHMTNSSFFEISASFF